MKLIFNDLKAIEVYRLIDLIMLIADSDDYKEGFYKRDFYNEFVFATKTNTEIFVNGFKFFIVKNKDKFAVTLNTARVVASKTNFGLYTVIDEQLTRYTKLITDTSFYNNERELIDDVINNGKYIVTIDARFIENYYKNLL